MMIVLRDRIAFLLKSELGNQNDSQPIEESAQRFWAMQ